MSRSLLTLLAAAFLLNACSLFQTQPKNAAVCKELKRRIIFNGATNNPQTYMQDKAQLGKLDSNYKEAGC